MIKIIVKLFMITLNYRKEKILIYLCALKQTHCVARYFFYINIILTERNHEHRCECVLTITNNDVHITLINTTKKDLQIYEDFSQVFAFDEKKFSLDYSNNARTCISYN